MVNKIKIGIIGCAAIAERSVIPTIIELSNLFELAGIASRDLNKAITFAQKFNTKPFGSYQSLVDDSTIDAVYIPLPNSLHAEWIEKSLKSGKHILVEKSLACSYDEVVYFNNLAQEKGCLLIENFQFRFHNQLKFIKQMVDEGVIGEIRSIRSSFGFPGLPTETDIRYQQNLGGGALLDTGAYPLKIAQIFMGYDIEVKASNLNYLPNKEVDIWGGAYLKQRNGDIFAEIAFGFNHFYQCNIEIWGSIGKLYTNRIFTANSTHSPSIELETSIEKKIITLEPDNHFKNMLNHFYQMINSGCKFDDEYIQNINQSRLISELKLKSHE